jgi:hypothetical protein
VYVDAYIPDKADTVLSLTSAGPGSVFAADASTLFDQVAIRTDRKLPTST